jgi:enoyl-[acyl-carrier protein] reductase II
MLKTWLTEILGIKHPMIQGGMGPYSTNRLAAAVANAGGLGIISLIGMGVQHSAATPVDPKIVFGEGTTEEYLLRSFTQVKNETAETGGVFGVNCPVAVEFLEAAKKLIFGTIEVREGDPELQRRLKVIITSAGDPLPWVETIRKTDLIWFHLIPSIYHLRRAEKAGVDAVIASGHEGGAHVSWQPVHSMVLIPGVVEATSLPVIGAGGICDGRTVAAALALGAVGVQMGTRFIATQECDFWDIWKRAVVNSSERDTLVGRGMFGPMRFIANAASMKLVEKTVKLFPGFFAGQPVDLHPQMIELERKGFLGGEASGRIDVLPKVEDLIERVITEASQILRSLPGLVVS